MSDHNILSSVHLDTLADSVVAGDLLYGNATPKWARLAKGSDGKVLMISSGLPAWADTLTLMLKFNAGLQVLGKGTNALLEVTNTSPSQNDKYLMIKHGTTAADELDYIIKGTVLSGQLRIGDESWLNTEIANLVNLPSIMAISRIGGHGLCGATRTSDLAQAGAQSAIGVSGFAINDNSSYVQVAYGGYLEARRKSGAGTTIGAEIDVVNQGSVVDVNPYSTSTGFTPNLWLNSGRPDLSANNASCAIGIWNNNAAFQKGIVVFDGSIETTNREAISLGDAMRIQWWAAGGVKLGSLRFDSGSHFVMDRNQAGCGIYLIIENKLADQQAGLQLRTAYTNAIWTMLIPASSTELRFCRDVDKFVFTSAQEFIPPTDSQGSIGTSSKKWLNAYLANLYAGTLKQNLAADAGITVDGVDISAHQTASPIDHPNRSVTAVKVASSYVSAYSTSAQSIPNSTDTLVAFGGEDFDTDGFHNNVTNNSRITIPSGLAGKYLFVFHGRFADNTAGQRNMSWRKNGSMFGQGMFTGAVDAAGRWASSTSIMMNLNVGDYVEVTVWQNSGASLNLNNPAYLQAFYLGNR